MAGSYKHVVTKDGKLLNNENALDMLDCYHGDVYETLEEMYGMIWYLAGRLAPVMSDREYYVEDARKNYHQGIIQYSPGVQD